MIDERWKRVEALYLDALRRPDTERTRFLDEACGGDDALNSEVASLLEQGHTGFLETPAVSIAARLLADDPYAGRSVGPYGIVSRIGSGGMGEVYRATDTRLQRDLAIKMLPAGAATSQEVVKRFQREARAASALNHPNICTVYDLGYDPPFIAMELLDGETLQQRLTRGRMSLPELVDIALPVADALDAAHRAGIVHRDVKPANVFLTPRGPKVLDFGIAKMVSAPLALGPSDATVGFADTQQTGFGAVIGTASYMSPEQVRAERLDSRSDIFSLGVVLYEMATGVLPFAGNGVGAVFDGILHRDPTAPEHLDPDVPSALASIIKTCLEKERDRRYQHASDICAALRRLGSTGELARTPTSAAGRRWRLILAASSLVLLAALVGYRSFHRLPVLTDKDTIVLADFTNTTGDPVFDVALRQGLAIQLEQSPFLRLVSDERVQSTLALMAKPPETPLTPALAQDVCERAGAAAVLDGSISAIGSHYVLGLRARNCSTGDVLDEEQVQAATKEDVLTAMSTMANRFRTRVGESLATREQHAASLPEVTTASLDALKAYADGRRLHASSGPAALPLFRRAIELDPSFAMAHAFLATTYGELGQGDLAAASMKSAYRLRDRATDWEKLFIAASYDLRVTGNLERAQQTYQTWIRSYPRAWEPHGFLAGTIYPVMGKYTQAVEEGKKAIELNPEFSIGYSILAFALQALNRMPEAEEVFQQAAARHVEVSDGLISRYDLAFLSGRRAEMERLAAPGVVSSENEAPMAQHEALAWAYSGRFREANLRSQQAVDLAQQSAQSEPAALYEVAAAVRAALFGSVSEARRRAAVALTHSMARDVLYGAAFALARSGESIRSTAIATEMERRFPEDTAVRFMYLPTLRAQLVLGRGDAAKAVEILEGSAPYELGQPPSSFTGLFGALYPIYLRGEAYLAAGQGVAAATEFQKIRDHRGVVVADPVGALASLQLGRAFHVAGNLERAKAAYAEFLALWDEADSNLAILQSARAEYDSLH